MNSFQDLNLSPLLQRAIDELGFTQPSPIQAQALPILLGAPTDFLGLAATGTGKTAAFSIPMLERIARDGATQRGVQSVVLCPTRELAIQVCGQINLLGKHMGVKAVPVYGGASFGDQVYGLKRGAQIVVGTPGRMCDHLDRGTLVLDDVSVVILDEADEMISMGFKEDLERILAKAPRESSQIWLFSATMSPEVRRLADGYLVDPQFVQINRTEMLPDTIEQLYYKVHESDKPEILCKLIESASSNDNGDFYGLVFCQTKALVVELTRYLKARGYAVDCLHGDMDQNAREATMRSFRNRQITVLICTDVASRGLDVKDITHVINYSLPRELDNYVHRIGRTARSGKRGVAMSLVTPSHKMLITRIERMTKSRMKEGRIPSRKEVAARKLGKALPKFLGEDMHVRALEVMDQSWKDAVAGMSPEEVAARFLAMMNADIFHDVGARQADAPPAKAAPVAPLGNGTVIVKGAAKPAVPAPRPAPAVVIAAVETEAKAEGLLTLEALEAMETAEPESESVVKAKPYKAPKFKKTTAEGRPHFKDRKAVVERERANTLADDAPAAEFPRPRKPWSKDRPATGYGRPRAAAGGYGGHTEDALGRERPWARTRERAPGAGFGGYGFKNKPMDRDGYGASAPSSYGRKRSFGGSKPLSKPAGKGFNRPV